MDSAVIQIGIDSQALGRLINDSKAALGFFVAAFGRDTDLVFALRQERCVFLAKGIQLFVVAIDPDRYGLIGIRRGGIERKLLLIGGLIGQIGDDNNITVVESDGIVPIDHHRLAVAAIIGADYPDRILPFIQLHRNDRLVGIGQPPLLAAIDQDLCSTEHIDLLLLPQSEGVFGGIDFFTVYDIGGEIFLRGLLLRRCLDSTAEFGIGIPRHIDQVRILVDIGRAGFGLFVLRRRKLLSVRLRTGLRSGSIICGIIRPQSIIRQIIGLPGVLGIDFIRMLRQRHIGAQIGILLYLQLMLV